MARELGICAVLPAIFQGRWRGDALRNYDGEALMARGVPATIRCRPAHPWRHIYVLDDKMNDKARQPELESCNQLLNSKKMAETAATTTPSATLTMKLLVDSSPQRRHVVFAEAGKDTVDFLFSLLAIPAGTAARLLGKESMAGCMGNLYSSAEKLADGPFIQPGAAKDTVLCAHMPFPAAAGPNSWLFRLPEPPAPPPLQPPKRFFNCSNSYYNTSCITYVTGVSGTRCPSCGNGMVTEARITPPPPPPPAPPQKAGFVQGGMATYMVTDDLVISPVSNVSTIALLNACAVRDLGTLQERVVRIGYKEGLEILKASLQSKTVLTDVFLGKPPTTNNGRGNPSLSNGRRPESLTWRA